jgi:hypothetical protein
MQSNSMDPLQAARQLDIIRTLMERAALYRRALGPITLLTGALGVVAAAGGWLADLGSPRQFGLYWMVVGCVGLGGAFVVVRRQALRDREPFWSPPTRRVTQALLPALCAGLFAGGLAVWPAWRDPLQMWWLPGIWMVLYGCAMHAAGFFMARGIKWFGWAFILTGCVLLAVLTERSYASGMPALRYAHLLMGAAFGGLHLVYGAYLHLTEDRKHVT